jgi:MerR family transcriptional regulator, copper efflux regulator
METLTIGQLAKQAGVNLETIRYYERQGLIPEPPRRASGYRQYSPDFVKRIQFIKRAQALGFSLKEIVDLLDLRIEPDTACDELRIQAEQKIVAIDEKIQTLERMKQVLAELVAACHQREPTRECPILTILDSDSTILLEK